MKQPFPHLQEHGRSMIEMLGVLAIIGVLTVGAIAMYSAAMSKYKINQAVEQIQALFAEIHDLYSAQPDYTGISFTVLENAQVVPDGLDGAQNGWGGTVTITPSGNANTNFSISYASLPQEVCVKIGTKDWNSDLLGVTLTSGGEITTVPIDVTTATANCTTGNENLVTLRFR